MTNYNGRNSRNPLDMTLGELISANRTNSSQQRGRGRGRPGGRRNQRSSAGRPVSRRALQQARQPVRRRSAVAESGSTVKIYISNLSYKVDNKDIEDLFSERGRVILKKSAVHYDEEGRSMGTAEVVFANKEDAASAIQKYNLRRLDGRPLTLEIVDRDRRNKFTRGGRGRGRGRGRGQGRVEDVDAGDYSNEENEDMELEL